MSSRVVVSFVRGAGKDDQLGYDYWDSSCEASSLAVDIAGEMKSLQERYPVVAGQTLREQGAVKAQIAVLDENGDEVDGRAIEYDFGDAEAVMPIISARLRELAALQMA